MNQPAPIGTDEKPWTYDDVVKWSGKCLNTIRKMVKQGTVKPVSIPGIKSVMFDPQHVRSVFLGRANGAA